MFGAGSSWRRRWPRRSREGLRRPEAVARAYDTGSATSTSSRSRPTRRRSTPRTLPAPARDPRHRRPGRPDGRQPPDPGALPRGPRAPACCRAARVDRAPTSPGRRRACSRSARRTQPAARPCAARPARRRSAGRSAPRGGRGRQSAIASAASSGVPSIQRVARFSRSSRCGKPSVGMKPGMTRPTWTPWACSSARSASLHTASAAFDAEYAPAPGAPDPAGGARDVDDRARRRGAQQRQQRLGHPHLGVEVHRHRARTTA